MDILGYRYKGATLDQPRGEAYAMLLPAHRYRRARHFRRTLHNFLSGHPVGLLRLCPLRLRRLTYTNCRSIHLVETLLRLCLSSGFDDLHIRLLR